jgi:hypothetical protein
LQPEPENIKRDAGDAGEGALLRNPTDGLVAPGHGIARDTPKIADANRPPRKAGALIEELRRTNYKTNSGNSLGM